MAAVGNRSRAVTTSSRAMASRWSPLGLEGFESSKRVHLQPGLQLVSEMGLSVREVRG